MTKVAPELREPLSRIAAEIALHARDEGETTTVVPGLKLYRISSAALIQRGIFRPAVCVVAQGQKLARAGADTTLRYGAGDFIASSVDMPMVGQVLGASAARPYLAVAFELSRVEVLSVAKEAKLAPPPSASGSANAAAFVGACDAGTLDVTLRALLSLRDERDALFLAPLLRRELIYRLARGPSAEALLESARLAKPDDGVGRAVEWLRTHFKEPLEIGALARFARMSPSSLHHKFKSAVLMGPLQYQKRLRLEEARRLLLSGRHDVSGAAFDVGYESPSQFTREYRRLFGLPPLRDVEQMREREDGHAPSRARRPRPRRTP